MSVAEINHSFLSTIYLYRGDEDRKPVFLEEVDLFKEMINRLGITIPVVEVYDHEVTPSKWHETAIFMVPGARSSDLDDHLGSKCQEIQDFVLRGGNFWGWCGGAYWAARRTEYRLNSKTTLKKTRPLMLWKGKEVGPLLPCNPIDLSTIEYFHGTVPIRWKGGKEAQPVLLSGGGSFIPADDEYPYEVLATYEKVDKTFANAVVKTYPGKGICILTNPYFTYGADYLSRGLEAYQMHFPNHPWKQTVEDLKGTDQFRADCFINMLLEFTKVSKENGTIL